MVWQIGMEWRRKDWVGTLQLWRPRLTVVSEDLFLAQVIYKDADLDWGAFIEKVLQFSEKMIWLGLTPHHKNQRTDSERNGSFSGCRQHSHPRSWTSCRFWHGDDEERSLEARQVRARATVPPLSLSGQSFVWQQCDRDLEAVESKRWFAE